MTNYKDILTKFQIEYDKEGGTFSSYPSLTEYEIATILDKAYLALIAQKLTGNNPRRAVFEADTKAIEDLRGLINTEKLNKDSNIDDPVNNEKCFTLPDDMLYFIQGAAKIGNYTHTVALISHDTAKNFFSTESNNPWIQNAVAFIEGNRIALLYDYFDHKNDDIELYATYIKMPKKFANQDETTNFDERYKFQLSDSMVEELINLAIIMALENVESQRLTTKVQTRPLES